MLTSFWVRLNWSNVVEIHAHVAIYCIQARVMLTLFSVWLGWPHVVKIHGQVEMYMGSGEGLFIRPMGSFVFFF